MLSQRVGAPSFFLLCSIPSCKCTRRSKTVIVCRWHDSVHRKSIDSTKKLLDLISEFGKIAGYEVNIQKSKAFLYTNNEISETEIRKKNPIWSSNKKNKLPRNKPNQGGKNLYSETTQRWRKKLRKTQTNGSMDHVHELKEWMSSKCPYYPKLFTHFCRQLLGVDFPSVLCLPLSCSLTSLVVCYSKISSGSVNQLTQYCCEL